MNEKRFTFGKNYSSGIYFVTLTSGKETRTLKLLKQE
ncbi:MAG: T9SS type A sorting domain-containing protein [Bacteroidetes bacterium]|nr:T9SS type A sorting domain-containing protein [Bacteroidota bacterium]